MPLDSKLGQSDARWTFGGVRGRLGRGSAPAAAASFWRTRRCVAGPRCRVRPRRCRGRPRRGVCLQSDVFAAANRRSLHPGAGVRSSPSPEAAPKLGRPVPRPPAPSRPLPSAPPLRPLASRCPGESAEPTPAPPPRRSNESVGVPPAPAAVPRSAMCATAMIWPTILPTK